VGRRGISRLTCRMWKAKFVSSASPDRIGILAAVVSLGWDRKTLTESHIRLYAHFGHPRAFTLGRSSIVIW